MILINEILIDGLNKLIESYKDDTDLPIWGEVFYIIHTLKQFPGSLYQINPVGDVIYDCQKRKFIIRVPEMQMLLKDHELVDAILYKGLFHPKAN